jgi:hypothetical protein
MPYPKGQWVRVVLAILADYLAGIADCIDDGGYPTTPEHSYAVSTCPKETPLIARIFSDESNYLTTSIDAGAIEPELLAPVRVNLVAKRRSDTTQALHTVPRCPNEGLS